MTDRFRPDPGLQSIAPIVQLRLQERAALIDGAWYRGRDARLAREVLEDAFAQCGAHEGTVWLIDGDSLVPAVNTGPNAARLVDSFRQPLARGLIGMVAVTEQAYCENDVAADPRRDATLDTMLGVRTSAMMAVPMVVGGAVRGVVSCVQFHDSPAPQGFLPQHLEQLERAVSVAGRLCDIVLLDGVLGLQGG
jgi:putative methionine-R-sulfoxide reductase with GAF domain